MLGRYPWIQQIASKVKNPLSYISLHKAFTLSSCPNYSFVFILVVAIIVLLLKIPFCVYSKPSVARTVLK